MTILEKLDGNKFSLDAMNTTRGAIKLVNENSFFMFFVFVSLAFR